MRKKVSNEEVRAIQLKMLDEIDSFCRQHNIRYSLAFGTLLGAARHKGYIPWDDDVDIIMPLPDMLRFKQEFRSDTLKYLDVDTYKGFEFHFSRVCHLLTYNKIGVLGRSYGVNIDIYPVVGLPDAVNDIESFFKSLNPLLKKRKSYIKWQRRLNKFIPSVLLPGFNKSVRQFRQALLFLYPYESSIHFLHAGRMHFDNVFDYDVFEDIERVNFEGHIYNAIGDYHRYLSHCYGDYMQLPPEDQRVPNHCYHYYWD